MAVLDILAETVLKEVDRVVLAVAKIMEGADMGPKVRVKEAIVQVKLIEVSPLPLGQIRLLSRM